MLQSFKPGYVPVGRKAIAETYIPRLYLSTKQIITSALADASYVAATSDTWTSQAGEPYIALTSHFIDNEWKMRCFTLCCRALNVDHTGQNISDWFLEGLDEWGLKRSKIPSFTIDNGDNVRLAVEIIAITAIRCLGHVIQNGVTDVEKLPGVTKLKKRVHALQQFFSSDKVWRHFKKFMTNRYENIPARKLPGVSPTRWWSNLRLFKIAIEDEKYHREFLAGYDNGKKINLRLKQPEIKQLKIYHETLAPLEELTSVLSGEEYVTASAILPIVYLIQQLQDSSENEDVEEGREYFDDDNDGLVAAAAADDDDYEITEEDNSAQNVQLNRAIILDCVLKKLKKRYDPGENVGVGSREVDHRAAVNCHKLLVKCSFLDPRFKNDLRSDDITSAKEQLLSEQRRLLQTGASSQTSTSTAPIPPPEPQPKKIKGLASVFAKLSGSSNLSVTQPGPSPEEKFVAELERYAAQPSLPKDEDVLMWWRDHAAAFPALSNFARKYLCCPGTSTPSERVFSAGGNIITDARVCLTGEHAEQQIFLAMNQMYVPKPK